MPKKATLRVQIDPELKESAESILKKMGIDMSEAITTFFHAIKHYRTMPGEFKVPNRTTRKVMRETDQGKNLIKYKNAEELFKDLGI